MLEELAENKDKIHGWDNKGSVRGEDSVCVCVSGKCLRCSECDVCYGYYEWMNGYYTV